MPPDPPRGSCLRPSYLITPLNNYSRQYEHTPKNLSYAPELLLVSIYSLGDLGVSSNLIGSLSRSNRAFFTPYGVNNA